MIKVDWAEDEKRITGGAIFYVIASTIITAVIVLILLLCGVAQADDVNMDVIKQIESSGNPRAYNRTSGARGHYQITPIVLEEFNYYKNTAYKSNDLFNPATNFLIADWYMNTRIPQMFKYFNVTDTVRNRIIAYNAGIVYARNGFAPAETRNYIKKYERALK